MVDQELLSKVKRFLRLDRSEDDDVLALLIPAAEASLAKSGVVKPDATDEGSTELYHLAVILFVKKEQARDEQEVNMTIRSLNSIILQLKSYGEV